MQAGARVSGKDETGRKRKMAFEHEARINMKSLMWPLQKLDQNNHHS